MQVKLNLLPEKRLRRVKRQKKMRIVIWREIFVVLAILLFIAFLSGLRKTLTINVESERKETEAVRQMPAFREMIDCRRKMTEMKRDRNLIYKIQQNEKNWAKMLFNLSEAIPEEIVLNEMTMENLSLKLNGRSQNRQGLLTLKENLKKNECFENPEIPLNSLVGKKDIDFEIKFDIDEKCLRKR